MLLVPCVALTSVVCSLCGLVKCCSFFVWPCLVLFVPCVALTCVVYSSCGLE